MRIVFEPHLALTLEAIANQVAPLEFSGVGYCRLEGNDIIVYDFVLMDVGSCAYTEISASDLLELARREDAQNGRVWIHRHPLGNGIPGPHNWSATDENTIQTSPLGGIPEIVKWSVSAVRTPKGWVGRIDNHITGKTVHLQVEGQAPEWVFAKARERRSLAFAERERRSLVPVLEEYARGYLDAIKFICGAENEQIEIDADGSAYVDDKMVADAGTFELIAEEE